MKEVVDRCMAYTARRHFRLQFAISGGDPLLNPDFWQLAEYLKQNDIPYAIMGNPFHLTQAVCDRLYTLGCTDYQVSIDGLRDTHDRMRRPGSFDATWACLPLLHKAGITSHVMSTVSHLNLWEIPDVIDLAVQHGVGVYGFARYVPTGPDKKNAIRPTEYRAFLDACYQKYRKYRAEGCLTQFAEKEHLFVLYKYEEGLVRIPKDAKPGCSTTDVTSVCPAPFCRMERSWPVGEPREAKSAAFLTTIFPMRRASVRSEGLLTGRWINTRIAANAGSPSGAGDATPSQGGSRETSLPATPSAGISWKPMKRRKRTQ